MKMGKIEEVCKRIDEVVNIDLIGKPGLNQLYEEVKKHGKGSMCLAAAKGLVDVTHPGNVVIICTGAWVRPWNANESDGPIGAAALARSLSIAFNAKPLVLVEEGIVDLLSVTCRAMELNVVTEVKQLIKFPRTVAVSSFPSENEQAKRESARLIKEINPVAIIAIEALGVNSKGVYHNLWGLAPDPDFRIARFDYLVSEARSGRILTVGIGDGGNEIGMGNIKDAVKKYIPFAAKCNCPCGAGTAVEGRVDSLVVSSVSNWGAYGISAGLACLLDNPNVLHSAVLERTAIEKCVAAGGFDGVTRILELTVDGMPIDIHVGIVNMLKTIITFYTSPLFSWPECDKSATMSG